MINSRLVFILNNIRSASNIGSVFRTSDALGVDKIFLCGISAVPPHKEILKTALGATQTVEWEYIAEVGSCISRLKQSNFTIVSIEQVANSVRLDHFRPGPEHSYALIFGNEVTGLDELTLSQSDFCLEIPQFGSKKSMNVSVVAGIVAWDFYCKLGSLR